MFPFRSKKNNLKTYYNEKNDDDDELFSGSSASDKLASLFDDDDDSPSKHAPTLKYVAPKQPLKETSINRPSLQQETTDNGVEVLYATDGKLFSYKNSEVKSFGPVMCGIIYSKVKNNFTFLIYKTRTNIISQTEITGNFNLSVQKDNYVTLTDDSRFQWSVHINNESHYEAIITQIGICRAYSAFTSSFPPSVVKQHLSEGAGEYFLQIGDEPSITYASWKVENWRKGCQVDKRKENVKVKIDQTTWKAGLISCRISQRCLIFVQDGEPSKGSILAYEVSVESQSIREDNGADVTSSNHESQDNKKASLISRMAKVGQPLLPATPRRLPNLSSIPTDSESDEERVQRRLHSNKSVTNTRSSTCSSLEEINMTNKEHRKRGDVSDYPGGHYQDFTSLDAFGRPEVPLSQGTMIAYQHPMLLQQQQQLHLQQQLQNLQQQLQILKDRKEDSAKQPNSESLLSLLFSESRTQNTDLRTTLSQLAQKVDLVYDKISNVETNTRNSNSIVVERTCQSVIKPRVFLEQITDLVEQLENTKHKLEEKEERIDLLTRDYTQILLRNQKLLEEKSESIDLQRETLESKNQNKIQFQELLTLQEEKIKTGTDLESYRVEVKRLKEQLEASTSLQTNFQKEIESLQQDCEQRSNLFSDMEMRNQNLQKEIENLMKIRENLEEESKINVEYSKKIRELEEASKLVREEYEDKVKWLEKQKLELEGLTRSRKLELEEKENQMLELREKLELELKEREDLELELKEREDLELELKSKDEQISKLNQINSSVQENKAAEMISTGVNTDPIPSEEPKASGSPPGDPETLGKDIMNLAYKRLKKEFSSTESYTKQVILESVVSAFRQTIVDYSEMRSADGQNPKETSISGSKNNDTINARGVTSTTDVSHDRSTTTPRDTLNDSVPAASLVGSIPSHAEKTQMREPSSDSVPVSSTVINASRVPIQPVPANVSPPAVQNVQMKSEPPEEDKHEFSHDYQSFSSKESKSPLAVADSLDESNFSSDSVALLSPADSAISPNRNLKLDSDIVLPADNSNLHSDHSSLTPEEQSISSCENHSTFTDTEDGDSSPPHLEDAVVPCIETVSSSRIPSVEDTSSTSLPAVENGIASSDGVPVVNVEAPANTKDAASLNTEDEDDDRTWKTGPPPLPPLFSDSEDDDDWLP